MRYSLRKQDKIKDKLGKGYLEDHILESLNRFFSVVSDDDIFNYIEPDGYVTQSCNVYSLLRINDLADSNCMLEFAIISQTYNVLALSYVGRIKE